MFEKIVGMRTIKSSIAVTIAIGLAQMLNFEYPFFAGMTAIIAMDKTALLSIKMARNRIVGTIFGAILGVTLSTLFFRGSPLLCGLGVIILCMLCNALHLQGAIGIGGIVMFAIMIHTDRTPMFYAVNRTATTILGGLVAVIVNLCVFPLYNVKHLNTLLVKLWHVAEKLVASLNDFNEKELSTFKQEYLALKDELEVIRGEVVFKKGREIVQQCELELHALHQLLQEIDTLQRIDQVNNPVVYQYHVDSIHQCYNNNFNSLN